MCVNKKQNTRVSNEGWCEQRAAPFGLFARLVPLLSMEMKNG